jgi:hypothetical protein
MESFGIEERTHFAQRPLQVAIFLAVNFDAAMIGLIKTEDHAHGG